MCGITGVFNYGGDQEVPSDLVHSMCSVIRHRGPDDEGVYCDQNMGFGMRRLSIIDLSTGHQPICNENKTVWVICNGEIYNFKEIKNDLERLGHKFYTSSDTEVIVHLYEQYGDDFVSKLRGMYAIALWDCRYKRLLLIRDRLGVKPLFYSLVNGSLFFGSEIKSILKCDKVKREVNLEGLNAYLSYYHVPAPDTMFKNINKLLPGHILVCNKHGSEIKQYWDVSFSPFLQEEKESYYVENIERLFEESVKLRLISDVPLGAFLSGGIDSSAIVGIMSKLSNAPVKTFSVGFEASSVFNELDDARLVAKHFRTDHHELVLKSSDVTNLVIKMNWHYDDLMADAASIPTYLVSEFAKKHVSVVLTGEGGDELFAGYKKRILFEKYAFAYQMIPSFIRNNVISRLASFQAKLSRIEKGFSVAYPPLRQEALLQVLSPTMKEKLYSDELQEKLNHKLYVDLFTKYYEKANSNDSLNRLLYCELKTWLADVYLVKTDRATMAVGLEGRVPFLDHKLVEFAYTIPSKLKFKGLTSKYVLRKMVEKFLPAHVLNKPKHGFSVPIGPWLRKELKDMINILVEPRSLKRGYFNKEYLVWLFKQHQAGFSDYYPQIWVLLNLEIWHRIFIDNDPNYVPK